MALKKVARIGDQVIGTCWESHEPRSFIGTWVTGSNSVFANGIGVVRLGDTGITDCGHTFIATTASLLHTADGIPIHRVDDEVVILGGGTGHSSTGSPTVDAT